MAEPSRLTQARAQLEALRAHRPLRPEDFPALECAIRALALVESLAKSENLQVMMECYEASIALAEGH